MMAESMAAILPAQNVPPPRPPPPKFSSSKTTEDLISTKPRKPRARKFHSMHGRAKVDKAGMAQRQVSLQEKLEENVTVGEDTSNNVNQVDEVDQPVVDSRSRKSPSKSPSRDSGGKASPVDGNNPLENGECGALTTKNLAEPVKPVEPVTQPQANNTSSSTAKDTLQSNVPTASSKRYRSVSAEDDIALLNKSSVEAEARQRSKTLPGIQRPVTDGVSGKRKAGKKTPPPPIPTRPPAIMQYQNRSSDGSTSQFRRSQSNSVSSHSSTPSIPEESTTPPSSPHIVTSSSPKVIPPSPDLCTPEIKIPEEVEDTNKPSSTELHSNNVSDETPSKAELSPTTKGKKKLLSGFKNTFRRRPKSPAEEKSMTLGAVGNRQPIIAHRRVKTVKGDVGSREESLPGGVIPSIIVQCLAYLNRESCLNEEGLFRIPGDMSQIRALRDGFLAGKEMDLSDVLEPHNIAGLLKLHYREMKINLIPRGEMSREITRAAKARDVDAVKDVLSQLPSENLALIRVIVELLRQVTDHSAKNQMTSGNLGASCGLSIFPTLQAGNASALLKCLVDYIETIFPE